MKNPLSTQKSNLPFPWPKPPKDLSQINSKAGSIKESLSVPDMLFLTVEWTCLIYAAVFIFVPQFLSLTFLTSAMTAIGFVFIVIASVIGLVHLLFRKRGRLTWDEPNLKVQCGKNERKYKWSDITKIEFQQLWKWSGKPSMFTVFFSDGTNFSFDCLPNKPEKTAFMIALGEHAQDSEETESAKPFSIENLSETKIRKVRFNLIMTGMGIILFEGFMTFVVAPIQFREWFLWIFIFTVAVIPIGYWALFKRLRSSLRAWRDNPAFTDPDRPIELLMYDQYGDLAEPLGRFYRHVWANDAKRNNPTPAKTDL